MKTWSGAPIPAGGGRALQLSQAIHRPSGETASRHGRSASGSTILPASAPPTVLPYSSLPVIFLIALTLRIARSCSRAAFSNATDAPLLGHAQATLPIRSPISNPQAQRRVISCVIVYRTLLEPSCEVLSTGMRNSLRRRIQTGLRLMAWWPPWSQAWRSWTSGAFKAGQQRIVANQGPGDTVPGRPKQRIQ